MIVVDVTLDGAGLLRSCAVSGHAEAGPAGSDVVCAAVSVLARTAFRTLSAREGIVVRGGAPERGVFRMEVSLDGAEDGGTRGFLEGAGAFLLDGLGSAAALYPEFCEMKITTLRRN